ncbi:MAG TPA: hypothetical protein VFA66_06640 [Gaiellaceae bacterium]|nr:hypothetical protein [Gaiellaceae bacterium]
MNLAKGLIDRESGYVPPELGRRLARRRAGLATIMVVVAATPLTASGHPARTTEGARRSSPAVTAGPPVVEFQPHVRWGGRTVAVDISRFANSSGNNDAIAATETGGIFRSGGAGSAWQHLDALPEFRIMDVRYSPFSAGVVLATAQSDSHAVNGGGIWRSGDGGSTWQHVGTGALACGGVAGAWGIGFAPDSGDAYVGTDCGVAVSRNSGVTWTNVVPLTSGETRLPSDVVSAVAASPGGVVAICGAMGLRRSTDRGATWTVLASAADVGSCSPGADHNMRGLAVSPFESSALFVAFHDHLDEYDVKSDGTVARKTFLLQPAGGGKEDFVRTVPSGAGTFDVWAGDGLDVFRQLGCTNTGGAPLRCTNSFDKVTLDHPDPSYIAFQPGNSCPVYISSDGGLQRTTDCGATWNKPIFGHGSTLNGDFGFNALQVYDIAGQVHPGSHTDLYFGTQDNSLWASGNGGLTWPNNASPEGFGIQLQRSTPGDVGQKFPYVSCGACQVATRGAHLVQTPGTGDWNNPPGSGSTVYPPALVGENVFFQFAPNSSGGVSLWRNTNFDSASDWVQVPGADLPALVDHFQRIFVAGSPSDPVLYVPVPSGSAVGLVKITHALTATAGDAAVIARADTGLANLGASCLTEYLCGNVFALGVDPSNAAHLIAADVGANLGGGAMVETFDGGQSWNQLAQLTNRITDNGTFRFSTPSGGYRVAPRGLGSQVHVIAFDPTDTNRILVGTEAAGIVETLDGGANWATIDGSQQIPAVSGFFFDDVTAGRQIVVSSTGRGLWKLPMSQGLNFVVSGIPAGRSVVAVDETTGARTALRPDPGASGGTVYRGLELLGFASFSTVVYHFEVFGAATPSSSHTFTFAERLAGVATASAAMVAGSASLSSPPVAYPLQSQTWVAHFTDSFGGSNVRNPTLDFRTSGASRFEVTYDTALDLVCLTPPPASGPACGPADPQGGFISNSLVRVDLAHTFTATSGTDRTVTWSFSLLDPAATPPTVYEVVSSAGDGSKAFLQWTPLAVSVALTHRPAVGTVSPADGTAPPGTFVNLTAMYSDPDGTADLRFGLLTLTGGVGVTYDRALNRMSVSDGKLVSCIPGSPFTKPNSISTPTVTLDCVQSSVSSRGNTMTVSWRLRFNAVLSGRRYPVTLQAIDAEKGDSGPATRSTFAVNIPPAFGALTPSSGSQAPGSPQTFAATFTDPDGRQNLNGATLRFFVSTGTSTFKSVELYYFEATGKIGINNFATTPATTCASIGPGAQPVSVSLATLNCGASSLRDVTDSSGKVVGTAVSWNVTPQPAMSGFTYTTRLSVQDDTGASLGPTDVGTWTVDAPPGGGVNDPASGSTDAGEVQRFVTTCSDPDGWHNIRTIDFRLGEGNDGHAGQALWAQFDENRGVLRLYDPDTGQWTEGAPGSDTVLSTRRVELRLGGSSVEGAGPAAPGVRVTWEVVFKPPAARRHYKQFLNITDDTGSATGWDRVGTWEVKR